MTDTMPMLQEGLTASTHDVLAATIISAYVSNHAVPTAELAGLIQSVRSALVVPGIEVRPSVGEQSKKLAPAEVKKSITSAGIVSFIDGRVYQTLKRHLTKHGMTFEQYKARFGLPPDYPATAPSYSAKRSQIAKDLGLGNPGRTAAA